ncbi:hypothetical protein A6U87_20010 [Rhizobium sp. AC44/96]|uniref:DUF1254 domain-containing protein n=1 Tax=Rhizobium sp. AC44/96 TaxID=1841654 RepID=UPI00080F80D6|nr:DUF1254 domain-containing protein [Rhizobium sp. AC44/96]OCJ02663.1 hypothetical protein A6U87_20010 [Rhizobium sp. AC44/96]
MQSHFITLTVGVLLSGACLISPVTAADGTVTKEEAAAIGVDAYLYLYPLVTMNLTREQATNVEAGKTMGRGPANMFVNVPAFPTADFRDVVRPNFDTLYSVAWLDMTKEPMIVSAPDTNGRYYLLPMLDMWTDVFASPGWRTTGTAKADFAVVPPGWTGKQLPAGTQRIDAPTPYVWVIGRTKTDGPPDYDAVHKIQAGYTVTPLSQWGKKVEPAKVTINPAIDMKTPPKKTVDGMAAEDFFAYAAELLKVNPPHATDQPIISRMQRIGLVAGKSFNKSKVAPDVAEALKDVPAEAQKLMEWKIPTLARVANNWSMNTDTLGVYGNYYLKRAIVAQLGLGANLPEDAIYPLNLGDEKGNPLNGANSYKLHFDKANLPPVKAFWSVTLYDPEGFQVGNSLNRFAVSSWMPFVYNADGSLDLYFQNKSPGTDKEANWLPAPAGPFNLTMRLYGPESQALTGKWNPPAVEMIQALQQVTAQ